MTSVIQKRCKPAIDFLLTMFLWVYFMFGYILFYIPVFALLSPFAGSREMRFQRMNHHFYRIFFWLLKLLTPGLTLKISKEVKQIRSSVIVSNHRSYLDPILLISIFSRHRTIVKGIFFKLPIMRWVMYSSGYIPFAPGGEFSDYMEKKIKEMGDFMKNGGNLFIFPEGRRSRDGRLGKFQKGAFAIARRNKTPVKVIYIENTDRLFKPGKFFFNTCIKNPISVELLGTIDPSRITVQKMRDKAIEMYKNRMKDNN